MAGGNNLIGRRKRKTIFIILYNGLKHWKSKFRKNRVLNREVKIDEWEKNNKAKRKNTENVIYWSIIKEKL